MTKPIIGADSIYLDRGSICCHVCLFYAAVGWFWIASGLAEYFAARGIYLRILCG